MPSALTDLLRTRTPPPEPSDKRLLRYESERDELDWFLIEYRTKAAELERQKETVKKAEREQQQSLLNTTLSRAQVSEKIVALSLEEDQLAEIEAALPKAFDGLKAKATHFHGSYFNAHRLEQERISAILSKDIPTAARWGDGGDGVLLHHAIQLSQPIRTLKKLWAPDMPQPHENRDAAFWTSFAQELLDKYSALKAFREAN